MHYYSSPQLTNTFKTLVKTKGDLNFERSTQVHCKKYKKHAENKTSDVIKKYFPSAKTWKMAHCTVFP